jgi:hypothetical protein
MYWTFNQYTMVTEWIFLNVFKVELFFVNVGANVFLTC